jgi:hypothetical protein
MIGNKRFNIYLVSCIKIDAEIALQKARKQKAEALGIESANFSVEQIQIPSVN